jgi:pyruvate, orthophosphate dikinase
MKPQQGMVKFTENERFVYDSYRRLVQKCSARSFWEFPTKHFEHVLAEYKHKQGHVTADTDLGAEDLEKLTDTVQSGLCASTRVLISRKIRTSSFAWLPRRSSNLGTASAPSITAMLPAFAHNLGTAVNIQTMVFGNMGWESGTGVAFTRDPANGDRKLYGDYLLNAQGEDVVAGIRNTKKISKLAAGFARGRTVNLLNDHAPTAWKSITRICRMLSLRLSAASSGCCRPATASAPPGPR